MKFLFIKELQKRKIETHLINSLTYFLESFQE